jgi:hypothetical protein
MIEGVATFLCRIMSKIIAEIEPRFGGVLDAFIGTSLVVAGNRDLVYSSDLNKTASLQIFMNYSQLATILVDTSTQCWPHH